IRSDGNRAARIVRSLLSFTRRSALERSITDLSELIRSTLALRAYELRASAVTVSENYDTEMPLLLVNREEIQQVVLNLILNAERAVRESGAPTIFIHTHHTPEFAVVEVSDTGPGVPTALIGRVFEPFFTTMPNGEGSGLGLSVSLGIAEAHGGSLALVPSEHGARFVLT